MDTTTNSVTWKAGWKNHPFRLMFIVTLIILFLIAFFAGSYFDFIESRSGPVLHDFILNMLPAADVSWVVFLILYSGILLGFYSLRNDPQGVLLTFQTYILVTMLRSITIYLIPLNPPDGYIALREPVAQLFANHHRIISHDLFFSGHVSTICSVLFAVRKRFARDYVLLCTIMVSLLVLVQRVHYTIDVAIAPVATYGCYLFAKRFLSIPIS